MNHRIINLPGSKLEGGSYCDVFERELETAVSEGAHGIALVLKPEMGACVELVEWLARWRKVLSQQGRQLVIIASDPRQQQYLELSHPDQELAYVGSLEELWKRYPAYSPPKVVVEPPPVQPQPSQPPIQQPPVQPVASSAPLPPPPPPQQARPVAPGDEHLSNTLPPQTPLREEHAPGPVKIGGKETVRISGEYACLGCGTTRMYAKGDTAGECKNPECMNPRVGWSLVFELF